MSTTKTRMLRYKKADYLKKGGGMTCRASFNKRSPSSAAFSGVSRLIASPVRGPY
ncbi:hypothetical protein XTGART10_2684 [Xanthomonas translucens pv. graminis]|nr:hypothetical protein XTGART9_2668 [Xanthomonas translucens pv. graminis]SBV56029.1 hypothetical protein XTGART10_2684 [Xanthomonas translucens pv. graminis]